MKHVRGFTATLYGITFDDFTETVINGSMTALMKYYSAAGQRIAMRQGNTLSFLVSDGRGSTTIALSSIGSVTAVQLFAPYGSSRYSKGSMPTDYNFTGQRLDRETGLLYYGARYYDPVSGRFTQADLRQNNVVGMDPYAYVGENPESRTDPTGQYFVPGGGNGSGSLPPRPTPPPAGPPSSQPSCTIYDCSVTLNHQTYSLGDILTDLNQRRNFLIEFYNVLATGFGVAELAFFDYLLKSGRLKDLEGYWNIVDFDLARDELIAAFDFTHHLGFQQGQGVSSVINNWLTFL